jgi:hypothetical protein
MARGPARVAAGRQRQAVLGARHPPVGLGAHLKQAQENLGYLQMRLPENEATADLKKTAWVKLCRDRCYSFENIFAKKIAKKFLLTTANV